MDQPESIRSVPTRTAPDLRWVFERLGVSIADWARMNGFSSALVYQVLAGRKRCLRGQSHQIAVRLGLKDGCIGTVADIGAQGAKTDQVVPSDRKSDVGSSIHSTEGESS
jgi:gp16 family phage-associated protein